MLTILPLFYIPSPISLSFSPPMPYLPQIPSPSLPIYPLVLHLYSERDRLPMGVNIAWPIKLRQEIDSPPV